MKNKMFRVILSNGIYKNEYMEYTGCEEEAVILAQAEAIKNGLGYKLISVDEVVSWE